jgi:hypothetical protein
MGDYVRTEFDPETDIIYKKPKDLPYEFKDFKVDLDFQEKNERDLKENYFNITDKEKRLVERMNQRILTVR